MQTLKPILSLAAVLGVSAVATTNFAEARQYRQVGLYRDYVISEGSCLPPPPTAYIYPTANWEPFFRRHVYRYGPILVCSPAIATANAISVRY